MFLTRAFFAIHGLCDGLPQNFLTLASGFGVFFPVLFKRLELCREIPGFVFVENHVFAFSDRVFPVRLHAGPKQRTTGTTFDVATSAAHMRA